MSENLRIQVTVPQQVWNELTDGEDGLKTLRGLRDDGLLCLVEVEREDAMKQFGEYMNRPEGVNPDTA